MRLNFKKQVVISVLLSGVLFLSTACSGKDNQSTKVQEPYEMDITLKKSLNGSGFVTCRFEEEQDANWADSVNKIYIRQMPNDPSNTPIKDSDEVDSVKVTVGSKSVMMDSDLFDVKPGNNVQYEVILVADGYDDFHMDLTVANNRTVDFTIRTIDGEGNVVSSKTFSFEEMDKMCTNDTYSSAGCVMHGLTSYHIRSVFLKDLLKEAGVEFKEGMSLATRVTDAPAKINATKTNSSEKTGVIFENPQSYWIKARYTDNYKLTYDYLYGKNRYFVKSQWEDENIGKILTQDEGRFDLETRVAMASNPDLLEKTEPMVAIQFDSVRYQNDPVDIREYKSPSWDLSQKENAFLFVFGLGLDDDTSVNVTSYDREKKEYPVVEVPSKAGLVALEEGMDACGVSARVAKNLMGIDIFLEGGVN